MALPVGRAVLTECSPFGGASRDRVLVDSRVAEQASVVLEMGSHEQSVRLQTAGLLELTEAEIVDICKEE